MKTVAPLCLALFVAAVTLADDAPKKDAPFDAAKLVGDWKYTAGTRAGDKVEKDRLAGTVKISKDAFTLPGGGEGAPNFVIAYKIDAKASPATIDFDIKDGPVKEGKAEGIIGLDGDEFKVCYVMTGTGKRPTKFESTKDNGAFYFVLKRDKK